MALYFAWNGMLLLAQVWAWLFTGSAGILAVASYTFSCLLSVVVFRLATPAAARPADDSHKFGHGKIESLWSAGQAFAMFVVVAVVVYSGVQQLFNGVLVVGAEVGIVLMAASAVGNYFISTRVPGLWARGRAPSKRGAYRQPVWDTAVPTTAMVGLILARFAGMAIADIAVGIIVSAIVVFLAWDAGYRAFKGLVDTRLPKHELRFIKNSINEQLGEAAGFRDLRTRRSGAERFIEMSLVFPRTVTLNQAHDVCDRLEDNIRGKVPNSYVIIHCEPCDGDSAELCGKSCPAVRNCHSAPKR
jgi:cation diffusion facilitator family transporter